VLSADSLAYDESYSRGFTAYLNQDYNEAKRHWLEAAQGNHARAMFNLGLLHEQGKIAQASSDKADNWFKLASEHGYAAADYHLALRWLAQGGRDEQAKALIAKAAKAGYEPARGRGRERARVRIDKSEPANSSKALSASKYLGEQWIRSKRPEHWTIQMLAFKERAKVESFIDEHQLRKTAAYFTEKSGEEVLYKLIYGVYDSKDKAEFARQNLPQTLAEFGPWLRPIASVQGVIDAAN